MGLLNFFVKKAVKVNARELTQSYLTVKQQNPHRDEKELYALVLESTHSYERDSSSPLVFTYKSPSIDVSKFESIKHLFAAVIIAEQRDLKLSATKQTELDSIVAEVIDEELKIARIDLMQ